MSLRGGQHVYGGFSQGILIAAIRAAETERRSYEEKISYSFNIIVDIFVRHIIIYRM